MTEQKVAGVKAVKECEGHCTYHVGITGKLIICQDCGRVKALLENGEWKMMY